MKSDLLVRLKSEGRQVTPERKKNSLKIETWLLTAFSAFHHNFSFSLAADRFCKILDDQKDNQMNQFKVKILIINET